MVDDRRRLFHPKKTEKYTESTTGVLIASGIWLRTLFYTSSGYEASQLGMQKIQPHYVKSLKEFRFLRPSPVPGGTPKEQGGGFLPLVGVWFGLGTRKVVTSPPISSLCKKTKKRYK
jgi:hypothetical protein